MLCLSPVLTFYDATPQHQYVCRQLIIWSRRSDLAISRWKLATSHVCFALHFSCRTTLCSSGEPRASFRVDRYEVPGLCHRHQLHTRSRAQADISVSRHNTTLRLDTTDSADRNEANAIHIQRVLYTGQRPLHFRHAVARSIHNFNVT